MMQISLNEIKKVIKRRQENSVDSLRNILCNGDYEVKSLRVGNEYNCIIEGKGKSCNFTNFKVMTGIVYKCQYLIARDFNWVNPEEHFEKEEQVFISKAIVASIVDGYMKANEEFTDALWKWIFELGKQS